MKRQVKALYCVLVMLVMTACGNGHGTDTAINDQNTLDTSTSFALYTEQDELTGQVKEGDDELENNEISFPNIFDIFTRLSRP
ncbi:MAG: hypothetical protein ACE5DN_03910 [Flavobacteriales bacterium]